MNTVGLGNNKSFLCVNQPVDNLKDKVKRIKASVLLHAPKKVALISIMGDGEGNADEKISLPLGFGRSIYPFCHIMLYSTLPQSLQRKSYPQTHNSSPLSTSKAKTPGYFLVAKKDTCIITLRL
jgi:hypothetical protein